MKPASNRTKQLLQNLLSTYSVSEIIDVFKDIDQKIISLHQCSSDDFLNLNAHFKKYYKDSKQILENATGILQTITNKEQSDNLLITLGNFSNQIQDSIESFEELAGDLLDIYERIRKDLDLMYIPSNNFKQNLMTLKLLVANLNLNLTFSHEKAGEGIGKKTGDFNEIISQTKSFYREFDVNLSKTKNQVNKILKDTLRIKEENNLLSGKIMRLMDESMDKLREKYTEAMELAPLVVDKTTNNSKIYGKVITNLQYQDIIRQKIEHIQQTHMEILEELNQVSGGSNQDDQIHNQARCFVKIRDIAGLQAAQLIHANKEYQKAIEIITKQFIEIGSDMAQISDMCKSYSGTIEDNDTSHFSQVIWKVNKSSGLVPGFVKTVDDFRSQVISSHIELDELVINFAELKDYTATLGRIIIKAIQQSAHTMSDESSTQTANQIKTILNALHKNLQDLDALFENTTSLNHSLSHSIGKKGKSNGEQKLVAESNTLLEHLNDINGRIYSNLAEIIDKSQDISTEINKTINEVKYYDYFEKVIEEIIHELNDINYKLKDDSEFENIKDKMENLDHLKSRYTMESEYLIHDQVSSGEESEMAMFVVNEEIDEDDDNLELF
jgi:hypothetical protein